jgi:uncharacterized protein (UPF0218 family)
VPVVVRLPDALREDLKDPLGEVYTDAGALLAEVSGPLVAVGDIVTYHLEEAGYPPDVALIDDRTERSAVDEKVKRALSESDVEVNNPAATLTDDLLVALRDALDRGDPVRIRVDGEEDLAALPAIMAAPDGASVVYGQPGRGMVHVVVDAEIRAWVRDFIAEMDGDPSRAIQLLEG